MGGVNRSPLNPFIMVYNCLSVRSADIKLQPHENPTRNGLSYTPSEMNELTARGQSTSLATLAESAYYHGNVSSVPIDCLRGVDANDMFEREYESRERLQQLKQSVHTTKSE